MLAERSAERELLDADELDPAELRANLRDLVRLNRLPGGTAASLAGVGRLLNGHGGGTIVDAGTGRADMPLAFARRGWAVLAIDHRPEILALAAPRVRDQPRVQLLEADARAIPIADASVDVAHASLVLHHFDPPGAVEVLRELRRVARRGVVVNDLRRGPAAYVLTWIATMTLTHSRYTRHDGPASARRAYTLRELDAQLVTAVGLREQGRAIQVTAYDAGLKPKKWLGTETVARLIGLRVNHTKDKEHLELQLDQPATRAEAAFSIARLLAVGDTELDEVRALADSFYLPALTPLQRTLLARALRFVGSPYDVWLSEMIGTPSTT